MNHVSRRPMRALLGAAIGFALVAVPTAAFAGGPVEDIIVSGNTTFTQHLSTEIEVGALVQPKSVAVSPDGNTAYVTARAGGKLTVVDLTTNTISDTVELPSSGGIELLLNEDGSRAYFLLFETEASWTTGELGVLDTETMTLSDWPIGFKRPAAIALNADEDQLYVLGHGGEISILETSTGAILKTTKLPGTNYNSIILGAGGTELLVGGKEGLLALNPSNLDVLRTMTVAGVSRVGALMIDQDPDRVYMTHSNGLFVINPEDGAVTTVVGVGSTSSPMSGIIGRDATNRAFSSAPDWKMVMAADFSTGKRSESFRRLPVESFDLFQNPVTGDLITANAGYINSEHGSSITVIHAPSVSDPVDQAATQAGEMITFKSSVNGIEAKNSGGVQWQLSADDGATWTDVVGATGDELTIEAQAVAIGAQVRLSWSDDFWGQSGMSAPATLFASGPTITRDEALPAGEVGEDYPETVITALGLAGLQWSATQAAAETFSGLPAGLVLNAETGAITGLPETAGDYVVTVTVTDAFGEDTKEFPLMIAKAATVPPVDPEIPPVDPEIPPVDPEAPPVDPEAPPVDPETPSADTESPSTTKPSTQTDVSDGKDSGLVSTGTGPVVPAMIAAFSLIAVGGGIWALTRRRALFNSKV